jgi:hypothetical protein
MPIDGRETVKAASSDDQPAAASNPLEDIQNRPHPFAD